MRLTSLTPVGTTPLNSKEVSFASSRRNFLKTSSILGTGALFGLPLLNWRCAGAGTQAADWFDKNTPFHLTDEGRAQLEKLNSPLGVLESITNLKNGIPVVNEFTWQAFLKITPQSLIKLLNKQNIVEIPESLLTEFPEALSPKYIVPDKDYRAATGKGVPIYRKGKRPPAKSAKDLVIYVRRGHGGRDPGAIGADGKTTEAQINAQTEEAFVKALMRQGVKKENIILGPVLPTDDASTVNRILAEVCRCDPHVAVHLHADSAGKNHTVTGTSVLVGAANNVFHQDTVIANPVMKSLEKLEGRAIKEVKSLQPRGNVRVLKPGVDYDPRDASILIERGYVTNPNELAAMQDTANTREFADAVAAGVVEGALNLSERREKQGI